jgi:hypothetical protein
LRYKKMPAYDLQLLTRAHTFALQEAYQSPYKI